MRRRGVGLRARQAVLSQVVVWNVERLVVDKAAVGDGGSRSRRPAEQFEVVPEDVAVALAEERETDRGS